jgi:hypothetical protein
MLKGNKYVVDYREIFRLADMEFGLKWNQCQALFFDTNVLYYKGWKQLERAELECQEKTIAANVLILFMLKENLDEMIVLG